MTASERKAWKRICRHFAEIKAERKARLDKVLQAIESDKRRLRRGDLDAGPVLELIERRMAEMRADHETDDSHGLIGLRGFCELRGISERAVQRARETRWITYKAADTICCRLGVPTATVYPYEQGALWELSA